MKDKKLDHESDEYVDTFIPTVSSSGSVLYKMSFNIKHFSGVYIV